jgi:hypothetical protein
MNDGINSFSVEGANQGLVTWLGCDCWASCCWDGDGWLAGVVCMCVFLSVKIFIHPFAHLFIGF